MIHQGYCAKPESPSPSGPRQCGVPAVTADNEAPIDGRQNVSEFEGAGRSTLCFIKPFGTRTLETRNCCRGGVFQCFRRRLAMSSTGGLLRLADMTRVRNERGKPHRVVGLSRRAIVITTAEVIPALPSGLPFPQSPLGANSYWVGARRPTLCGSRSRSADACVASRQFLET